MPDHDPARHDVANHDAAEQISDALARLRWHPGLMRPGHRGRGAHDQHGQHERHSHWHEGRGRAGGPGERRMAGGPALGRLLWALAAAGDALIVSDLAERVGVDQPRASRLVAQAVDFGFVRREADPNDARRTRIVLTEEGSAMIRRLRGRRGDAVREALSGFTDDEREQLASLLARLADAWPNENVGGRL